MDPLTHAVFGAVTVSYLPFARRNRTAWALAGIAAAFPDLDHAIPYHGSHFERHALHRFFTHTLFLAFIEALFLAWVFRYLSSEKTLDRSQRYTIAFFALLSHIFLDFSTTSGLPLLWPFTSYRFALDIFPILDPLFLGALCLMCLGLWIDKRVIKRIGSTFLLAYVLVAGIQRTRAIAHQDILWQQRHHNAQRAFILPMMGSLLRWRSIYEHEKCYYVDDFRLGWTCTPHESDCFPKVTLEDVAPKKGTEFYKAEKLYFWTSRDCVADFSSDDVWGIFCPIYNPILNISEFIAIIRGKEVKFSSRRKFSASHGVDDWVEHLFLHGYKFEGPERAVLQRYIRCSTLRKIRHRKRGGK
ncbi:MAG: metal-dependent hydrolase [Holosporales bacterium]|jgi:membrane-bound metal-dependent hydrolase YbcI (DUF457 family)|nr:metal-dependent hydrolase [Holosporales bacterium]